MAWIYHMLFSLVTAVFCAARVENVFHTAGVELRFAAFLLCAVVCFAVLEVLFYFLQPVRRCGVPKSLWFWLGFAAGVLGDRTEYICDLSRFQYQGIVLLLCALGSGVFFGLFLAYLAKSLKGHRIFQKGDGKVLLILFGIINLGAVLYICMSKTVYYWDNAGYWSIARTISQRLLEPNFYNDLVWSVLHDDYNYLIALPVSILMRLFGPSRLVFVLGITNFYLLPALLVGYKMATRVTKKAMAAVFSLLFLFPALLFLTYTGFIDVGAFLLAMLAFYCYTSENLAAGPRYFLTSLCAVGTFVLRRYFLFFTVAFLITAFVLELVFKKEERKKLWHFPLCAVFTAFYFMQPFLLEKVLGTNYAYSYQAYQLGLATDCFLFTRYFGLAVLGGLLAGGIWGIYKRSRTVMAAAITAALCFLLFTRVQTHGQQHLLLYLPSFFLIGLFVLSRIKSQKLAWGAAGLSLALVTGNTFVDRVQPQTISEIRTHSILPSFSLKPVVRGDIGQLVELRRQIDNLSDGREKPARVAVLASSFLINTNIMENIYWSVNQNPPETRSDLVLLDDVDKRDGTNEEKLKGADYILLPTPVQTHLKEGEQTIITEPAKQLLAGSFPGFTRLETTFYLDDLTIYVFQKTN